MIDPVAGHDLGERAAYLLAEADPLRAVDVLVRGLKIQPRGGKIACARRLIAKLIAADAGMADALHHELARETANGR